MYQPPSRREGVLIFFMCVCSMAIVYSLYLYNPYFMNKTPLSMSLAEDKDPIVPIPEPVNSASNESIEPLFLDSRDVSGSYHEPENFTINPTYIRQAAKEFIEGQSFLQLPLWAIDDKLLYVNSGNKLFAANHQGQTKWWFEAQPNDSYSGKIALSANSLFAATSKGHLYKFDKNNGHLDWLLETNKKILFSPLLYKNFVYLISAQDDQFFLSKVNGHDGQLQWIRKLLGFTAPSQATISEKNQLLLITDPNGSLLCLDLNNGNAYWQKKKLGEVSTPATVVGEVAYVGTSDAKLYAIHLKKKEDLWVYELTSGATSPITHIPGYNHVAVLTQSGYLHIVDATTGEGQWRYNTYTKAKVNTLFAVRFNSVGIQRYKLKWVKKGWVLVSSCSEDRLCLLNPENGQLVTRIRLRGQLGSQPIFVKEQFFASLISPEKLPWIKNDVKMPPFALGRYEPYTPPATKNPNEEEGEEN